MNRTALLTSRILPLVVAAALIPCPLHAEKPTSQVSDKAEKHQLKDRGENRSHQEKDHSFKSEHHEDEHGVRVHFGDRERSIIRDYFDDEFRRGDCPPGLAKKHNGCLPPGQAKKWEKGRPLPNNVVYYD